MNCSQPLMRTMNSRRHGMTLLEVMLALLVLVVAMGGITMLASLGRQSGADARDLTMGQLLCEGKIAEIAAGVTPPSSTQGRFPNDPDWTFSVTSSASGTPGLLNVRVTVTQDPATYTEPLEFALVRWIPDPDFAAELAQ
ncbi:MAG: prepilin-type N-terminal cleavage/methylation domain-containing protein [Pirellulaceae bacterium]|nr:prepilin-type N-terminal cleavage/methylation domain-containing protein [Pirellulaceae bacterium]